MSSNKSKNRNTYFYLITVAALLLVVALIIFTALNGQRIRSENRTYLMDNANQVANSLDDALNEGYDNIKILSSLVSDSLTGPEFDITSIQGLIKNSVFDFMEFADKDGMDHNITGGVSDARDRQYYLDAKAGNTGMELIYVSRATHETLLMFYSPIYYHGEFVGSLVGAYQATNRITHQLSCDYFGEAATSYLATEEGRIIASSKDYDPTEEKYVTDLAGGNKEVEEDFENAIKTGRTLRFSLKENTVGGCMIKLPDNDWYLVQIFPQKASLKMIRKANSLAYALVFFLLVLYVVIMTSLIRFYRKQQSMVEEARNQAEIANQAKTNFLFNMSHDIRTPMNAITGFTDRAMRHINEPDVLGNSLEKVQSSSKYLLRIINDILDMAKIESGKLELNETVSRPIKNADAMMEIFAGDAANKDIILHREYRNIGDEYIWIDEGRCNQIIANLISNAIKYTPPGGEVWYSVEQIPCDRQGYARFRSVVKDNGKGMSPEFVEKIFEEFEREQSATKSGEQGTGLGMAIVKNLVEMMDGTIEVKSEIGKGTSVIFEMEHRIANPEEISEYEKAAAGAVNYDDFNFAGRVVLVVEDNELNREIAVELLEEEGFEVEEAEDGSVAVKMIEEKGIDYYDCVLMDIQMPIMDGFEATAEIRKLPAGGQLPIIALSANAFEEDRQKSLAAGMNDHIAKPVEPDKLKAAIAKYM